MSFPRLARPVLTSQRLCSSFFSSKPGGGRYLNAAKAPKSVVISNKADKATPTTAPSQPEEASSIAKGKSSSTSENQTASDSPAPSPIRTSSFARSKPRVVSHPVINEKECRLHQFFALHRPMVLMTSRQALQQPPPGSLHDHVNPQQTFVVPPQIAETESSAEADADTARQIMRALTMSIVGSVKDWENTLRRLGLDMNMEPERISSRMQMSKEWREVVMDSTKRKRRRKMKKHK